LDPNSFVCSAASSTSGILSNSEQTGLGRIAHTPVTTPRRWLSRFLLLTERREELKCQKRAQGHETRRALPNTRSAWRIFEQGMSTQSMPVHRVIEDRLIGGSHGVAPDNPQVVCPKCRWNCGARSRRRNGLDLFLALFALRAFRCRSCHRRFYRLSFSPQKPFRLPSEAGLNANAHSKRKDTAA
jgi:hypothetical protein